MANPPGTRLDIVVCQKHGLRYNRAVDPGCAMCRREGTTAEPARPAASSGAVRTRPAPPAAPRPTTPPAPPQPRVAATPTPPRPSLPAPAQTPASPADVLPTLLPDLPPEPEALTATGSRKLEVAVCEKHGLRYNRAVESGCVRCRRESGVTSTAGAAAGRPGAAVRPTDPPASTGIQLLIAALLVGGTAGLCFAAHEAVLESFASGLLVQTGSSGIEAAAAPGEAYGENTTEPAAWPPPRPTGPQPTAPPGMKGRGPVEQQKQIEEFFRLQQEEEAKERGEAPPPAEIPQ